MPYTIKPLLLGRLKVSKGQMTYFVDWGKEIWTPIVAWYIKAMDTLMSAPHCWVPP